MGQRFTYGVGAELPSLTLPWQEQVAGEWVDLDLSSGYSWTWNLEKSGTWAFTDVDGDREDKTTGVTGYDGGVVLAFAVDDLEIATGNWVLYLRGREIATNKDRDYAKDDRAVIYITAA